LIVCGKYKWLRNRVRKKVEVKSIKIVQLIRNFRIKDIDEFIEGIE